MRKEELDALKVGDVVRPWNDDVARFDGDEYVVVQKPIEGGVVVVSTAVIKASNCKTWEKY
jgi:hypothetical protein